MNVAPVDVPEQLMQNVIPIPGSDLNEMQTSTSFQHLNYPDLFVDATEVASVNGDNSIRALSVTRRVSDQDGRLLTSHEVMRSLTMTSAIDDKMACQSSDDMYDDFFNDTDLALLEKSAVGGISFTKSASSDQGKVFRNVSVSRLCSINEEPIDGSPGPDLNSGEVETDRRDSISGMEGTDMLHLYNLMSCKSFEGLSASGSFAVSRSNSVMANDFSHGTPFLAVVGEARRGSFDLDYADHLKIVGRSGGNIQSNMHRSRSRDLLLSRCSPEIENETPFFKSTSSKWSNLK
jgi:hypothetical protein